MTQPSSAAERVAGRVDPFPVSRTVLEQVVREGVALLSNDVLESESLRKAQSLKVSHVTSLIAVPLLLLNKILGVLYLDTKEAGIHFDGEHLQLMTAIAGIAAVSVETAKHMERLENENKRLLAEINIAHNMIGEGTRMREVYQFIAKVAPSDSTVFIRGESGTGKELAAYAVHLNSRRLEKPFVVINCATLTETLLESELFGYEKGAFTGALAQRKGKLEVADGGTVFLDEVAELSTQLQTKLLRVLQEREFERVGGTRPIHIDVRFIAATNKDLEEAIKNASFRQDLYYRLNVVSITMPPLRERREDIPLLATYFASKFSKESKRRVMGISAEARSALLDYHWPGNVRELENAIERAVVLGSGEMILPDDLPEAVLESKSQSGLSNRSYYDTVQQSKRQVILNAMQQANGNYNEAAKLLEIHPNNLHRLIRNLNIKALLNK